MKDKQIGKLVQAMIKGEDKAFEKLYNETKNSIYFICINFLHNEEDAKDIMQETYVTAYKNINQLNDKEKFIPWLSQIAVNKCKRHLMNTVPIFLDYDEFNNVTYEENENFLPEEYIIKKEKRKIVMDIMRNSLSDIQYQTVILYYFNGLNINEVADIMECPPGTVTYRLSVARGKIKEGVLTYENRHDDRLYVSAGVPFLVSFFAAESVGLKVPNIFPDIMGVLSTGTTMVSTAGVVGGTATKTAVATATKVGIGAVKTKIAIGVTAAVIATGGTAAIVMHNNSDKKEVVEYETIEPKDLDVLIEYFETEYGFTYYPERTSRNIDKAMEYHKLELVEENITTSLQIDVYEETGIPRNLVVIYESQNYNEDCGTWMRASTFLCENSKDKEKLEEVINSNKKTEIVIGKYRYEILERDSLGYCGPGESNGVVVIYFE